jgi:hypothetical protein
MDYIENYYFALSRDHGTLGHVAFERPMYLHQAFAGA